MKGHDLLKNINSEPLYRSGKNPTSCQVRLGTQVLLRQTDCCVQLLRGVRHQR